MFCLMMHSTQFDLLLYSIKHVFKDHRDNEKKPAIVISWKARDLSNASSTHSVMGHRIDPLWWNH